MRLTTARLRALIVNRAAFVAAARQPMVERASYGNAQRVWLQAAIRAYFRSNRNDSDLWRAFRSNVERRPGNQRRESLAAGATALLEQFLLWDKDEEDSAADCFPPVRDVPLGAHIIAVRHDLIYLDGPGYKVRQLWTDHELRPDHPSAIHMAAAVMLSADSELGAGSTTRVEVWGLRHRLRHTFDRGELAAAVDTLNQQLDQVVAEVQRP